jgi:hypothetical protein
VRGIAGLHPDERDALLALLRARLPDPNLHVRWRWPRDPSGTALHDTRALGPPPEPARRAPRTVGSGVSAAAGRGRRQAQPPGATRRRRPGPRRSRCDRSGPVRPPRGSSSAT